MQCAGSARPTQDKKQQQEKTVLACEVEGIEIVGREANPQFFGKFADECVSWTLARLNFAAREFPQSCHGLTERALLHQYAPLRI
jgi:hypothetical protein